MLNKINRNNSSLAVQCNARKTCSSSHSALCESCRHNRGPKKYESYYKPRKISERIKMTILNGGKHYDY